MNSAGDAIVAWGRFADATGPAARIQAAVRPAGGSFSAPINLSPASDDSELAPRVAINEAGDAIVVWTSAVGAGQVVRAAVRPAGADFLPAIELSEVGKGLQQSTRVAIGPAGEAIVVWHAIKGDRTIVRMAARTAGGSFLPAIRLSPPGDDAGGPDAAIDFAGNAIVVWSRIGSQEGVVQAITRPAGGTFSTPVGVSPAGAFSEDARVALGPSGDAAVVWLQAVRTSAAVGAAVRPAEGSFSAPVTISAAGFTEIDSTPAIDRAGNVIAIWSRLRPDDFRVQAAIRPAGAGFSAPADLYVSSPSGDLDGATHALAMNPAGDARAVWSSFSGGVFASSRRPGTPFSKPAAKLSGGGAHPQVAIDGAGNAIAVWERLFDSYNTVAFDPHYETVQAAIYDTGGQAPLIAIPAVDGLTLASPRFHAARSGPATRPARDRGGVLVSYMLNQRARVRFTIQRQARERLVGMDGSFGYNLQAGVHEFRFTGRLDGRTLKPGRYRLLAAPTANGRSGAITRTSFRIVGPRGSGTR